MPHGSVARMPILVGRAERSDAVPMAEVVIASSRAVYAGLAS